jgi:polyribonucleotide nucleotidyltransferase
MNFEGKKIRLSLATRRSPSRRVDLAGQAGGALTLGIDDAIVFASATMGGVREGIDFFPLSVDYEERLYAGGKIPGSFFRREGRASTESILTSRLTDRPLRPLFQDGMRNEVQVIMYSFSSDGVNPLDVSGDQRRLRRGHDLGHPVGRTRWRSSHRTRERRIRGQPDL